MTMTSEHIWSSACMLQLRFINNITFREKPTRLSSNHIFYIWVKFTKKHQFTVLGINDFLCFKAISLSHWLELFVLQVIFDMIWNAVPNKVHCSISRWSYFSFCGLISGVQNKVTAVTNLCFLKFKTKMNTSAQQPKWSI